MWDQVVMDLDLEIDHYEIIIRFNNGEQRLAASKEICCTEPKK